MSPYALSLFKTVLKHIFRGQIFNSLENIKGIDALDIASIAEFILYGVYISFAVLLLALAFRFIFDSLFEGILRFSYPSLLLTISFAAIAICLAFQIKILVKWSKGLSIKVLSQKQNRLQK